MARNLPDKCLRGLDDCTPLCNIVSDDGEPPDFICVGTGDPDTRTEPSDCFRVCFKTKETDTKHDLDEIDMLDMSEMCMRAISTKKRMDDGE